MVLCVRKMLCGDFFCGCQCGKKFPVYGVYLFWIFIAVVDMVVLRVLNSEGWRSI